jgi:hypothetical protein
MKATHTADLAAGLLLLSRDGARLDEWHPNATLEIERFELGAPMADSHELRGPSASHPRGSGEGAPGIRSSQQRDLYERRLEQHRIAFVRELSVRCARLARAREWRLVLVLGEPHLTGPAADVLRKNGVGAAESNRLLGWMTPAELARAAGPEVESALLAAAAGASVAR